MSLLTEIQYLQIEPSEKGHVTMKVWCLKCSICRDSSDEQNAFDGLEINYLLVYKLWTLQTHHVDSTLKRRGNDRFHVISTRNPRGVFVGEFLQLQMKQTLSSVQKNPCITVIADKKIISLFCLSGVLCSPPQSSVQIK